MKPILKAKVFFKSEDSTVYELLDKRIPLRDCDLRIITFYKVDYILSYVEEDEVFSMIGSGGQEFISPHTVEHLENLLANVP